MRNQTRYEIENKTNKFMEFVSREMMRTKRNKSQAEYPRNHDSRLVDKNPKGVPLINDSAFDIYSQPQLPRQRRGASVLKSSSKSRYNDSLSKVKKDIKDTSLNFYEGLKTKSSRQSKEHPTGLIIDQNFDIEELHYQMVAAQQNAKSKQRNVEEIIKRSSY